MGVLGAQILRTVGGGIPTDGLIAYYPFDGDVTDQSGNGNDLTLSGSTGITYPFARNGKQCIQTNGAESLTGSGFQFMVEPFSVSLWIRFDTFAFSPQTSIQIPNQYITPLGIRGIWRNTAKFDFIIDTPAGRTRHQGIDALSIDTWYNFIVTYSSSFDMNIWLNGSLASVTETSNDAEAISVVVSTLKLDGQGVGTNSRLSGFMDDIRFYNRVLTTSEITAIAND